MKIAPRVPTALRALSPSTAAVRVRPTGSDDRVVASETSWVKQTLPESDYGRVPVEEPDLL